MSDNQGNSLDVLGLKPVGEAINTLTKGVVKGTGAFLSKVCLPASEEFGLLLKDKVSHWRQKNALNVAEKFEKKFNSLPDNKDLHAHPRIATIGLERGSWADSDEVQEMWAGLLTSSCTRDGQDDSNLIFINLLDQLTFLEAKILNYACEKSKKLVSKQGLIYVEDFSIEFNDLVIIFGEKDIYRLDRDLDHLRSLDLLDSGFPLDSPFDNPVDVFNSVIEDDSSSVVSNHSAEKFFPKARLTPNALGLYFYVRCQGSLLSPIEFFRLSNTEQIENSNES